MAVPAANLAPDDRGSEYSSSLSDIDMEDAPEDSQAEDEEYFRADAAGIDMLLQAGVKVGNKATTKDAKQQIWLASYPNWRAANLGPKWKAVKVLGQGGFGVVGLWKWDGDDKPPGFPDHVVIKQAEEDRSLGNEEVFLKAMEMTKTRHVVQLYGTVYTEPPEDPSWNISAAGKTSRIFLEYCDQGSVEDFVEKMMKQNMSDGMESRDETVLTLLRNEPPHDSIDVTMFTEEEAWILFLHMAKALTAMQRGNDNAAYTGPVWPDLKNPDGLQIVHFDFKPANILFHGERDDNQRIFKVSDFGLAKWIQPHDKQSVKYVQKYHGRGTPGFRPPEQTFFENEPINVEDAKGLKLGHESNVWNLGVSMLCVLNRSFSFESHQIGNVHSDTEYVAKYSKELRTLVASCCEEDWSYRPSPLNLQKAVIDRLKALKPKIPVLKPAKADPLEPLYWVDPLDKKAAEPALPWSPKRGRSQDDESEEPTKRQVGGHGMTMRPRGVATVRNTIQDEPGLIKVFVTNRPIVMIEPTATVQKLLESILPGWTRGYQIKFQDKMLIDPLRTLLQCGIKHRSEVRVVSISPPASEKLLLTVFFGDVPPNSDGFTASYFKVFPTITVWDLAKEIAAKETGTGGITRRAYGMRITYDGMILDNVMKTLRSYNIVNNSVLWVTQAPERVIDNRPQGPPAPTDKNQLHVGYKEHGKPGKVALWRDIDFGLTLQVFLQLVAEKYEWRCMRVIHVNRKENLYLSDTLTNNSAVNGCYIDVEGGKDPIHIVHNVEGTTDGGGRFEIKHTVTLHATFKQLTDKINETQFQNRFLRGTVRSVDGKRVDYDEDGDLVEQDQAILGEWEVHSGSEIAVTFTRPRVNFKYRDSNQQQKTVLYQPRMDLVLKDFIRAVLLDQNLTWLDISVVHATFPQKIDLRKTLRELGATDDNEIEVVDKTVWIQGITMQWPETVVHNSPDMPEDTLDWPFQWALDPHPAKESLRDIILDHIKKRINPPWNDFRVVAINGQPPAADIFGPGRRTLRENNVKDGALIEIESVVGNPTQPPVEAGASQAPSLPEASQPANILVGARPTVTDLTMQYLDADGMLAAVRTPVGTILPANGLLSEVIWQLITGFGLGWKDYIVVEIDGISPAADIERSGRRTFTENNIRTGSVIRIQEAGANVDALHTPHVPQLRPDMGAVLRGVEFHYLDTAGHAQKKKVKFDIRADMSLLAVIQHLVNQERLPWNDFTVLSINGQTPAPQPGFGLDLRNLAEHNIQDGSVIVIAQK